MESVASRNATDQQTRLVDGSTKSVEDSEFTDDADSWSARHNTDWCQGCGDHRDSGVLVGYAWCDVGGFDRDSSNRRPVTGHQ